jgi:hypothetical protein
LAANLITGYHGPLWAEEDIALLGQVPEAEVTPRTGQTVGAVRQKREELAIPNPAGNRWRDDKVALLGTLVTSTRPKRASIWRAVLVLLHRE